MILLLTAVPWRQRSADRRPRQSNKTGARRTRQETLFPGSQPGLPQPRPRSGQGSQPDGAPLALSRPRRWSSRGGHRQAPALPPPASLLEAPTALSGLGQATGLDPTLLFRVLLRSWAKARGARTERKSMGQVAPTCISQGSGHRICPRRAAENQRSSPDLALGGSSRLRPPCPPLTPHLSEVSKLGLRRVRRNWKHSPEVQVGRGAVGSPH